MVRPRSRIRSRLKTTLVIAALTILVIALIEGTSSLFIMSYEFVETRFEHFAENRGPSYYEFDADLGWSNIPNAHVPDRYGEGRYVRINARGFRNDEEIDIEVPEGRIRVICSGDSFTFGQGVANDRTWCAELERRDPRIQAVNMGEPGYGVDQAYLWYVRDGAVLDHDLHVFAFIEADFNRLGLRRVHGYPKPYLQLVDGTLVADNVPIPRFRLFRPWMSELGTAAADLRVIELVGRGET